MQKLIVALVAAVALAGGLYLNLESAPQEAGHPLSNLAFDTPEGQSLELNKLKGKITVVNFWATWCPPCVEEMPEFDALYTDELAPAGIELLGVAVDTEANVKTFLEKTPVQYPVVLAGFGGTELAKDLGNSQGGLPFTVILDEDGNVLLKKAGRIYMDEVRNALPNRP